jgi:dynamin 1-like protein
MEREGFAGNFFDQLRSVVTLVDHLRDAGLQQYVRLPRIVTLGTQSSGKSSVLESIVGLNFLPRNEGVCTRRPLELRLVHVYDKQQPWARFEGSEQKYTNFELVRKQIQALTDAVAGSNKSIVDDPIVLTIYSDTCPDLTLIDLPGITRIPIGDQPQDIERITKEMAYRYISDPRTIILCVIPANADMTTSDGLMMARKVDTAGIRTIGVITKIDIMDRGTNAKRMILGQEVALRLGFVGVKNRSQQDISESMPVQAALMEEKRYFASHAVYSTMPEGSLGTAVLTQKLSSVLFTHIRHFLPDILREVNAKLKDTQERLIELGPAAPTDKTQKLQMMWQMTSDFCDLYKNSIRGKHDRRASSRITKGLHCGLEIRQSFNKLLNEFIGDFKATSEYSDQDIQKAISLHEGDSIPGFPSMDVFAYLIHPQLEKLQPPVLDCLSTVHSHLENLAQKIIDRLFNRFPGLIEEIGEVASRVLSRALSHTRELVEKVIAAEESYFHTNDEQFLSQRIDISGSQSRTRDQSLLFIDEVRTRIDNYYRLVVRNLRDSVPKLVGFFLVRATSDRMQLELYEYINKSKTITDAMNEPAAIAGERETLQKMSDTLKKAQKLLKQDAGLASQTGGALEKEIERQEAVMRGEIAAPAEQELPAKKPVERNASMFGAPTAKQAGNRTLF